MPRQSVRRWQKRPDQVREEFRNKPRRKPLHFEQDRLPLSSATASTFEAALKICYSVRFQRFAYKHACADLGVSRKALYNWRYGLWPIPRVLMELVLRRLTLRREALLREQAAEREALAASTQVVIQALKARSGSE